MSGLLNVVFYASYTATSILRRVKRGLPKASVSDCASTGSHGATPDSSHVLLGDSPESIVVRHI